MEHTDDIDKLMQSWQTYKQKALQSAGLSENELREIFDACQQMPPLPSIPLPHARNHRLRHAATVTLILLAAGFFLLTRNTATEPDTPMLAQLADPVINPSQLPAVDVTPAASPQPAPHHRITAKADNKTADAASYSNPLPDEPTPQPAAATDTTEHIHFILSPDNVQYASLICNSKTCDSQYYITQILNNLLS